MLVLEREPGEIVKIGDAIEVHVISIRGGKVRLGFTAPKDIAIPMQIVVIGQRMYCIVS